MTENSFAKVCRWLQSHYLQLNSIYIVLQKNKNDSHSHEAWKYAGTIGDRIMLERSQGHGNPYLKKEITKDTFKTLESFLACVQISLSKETILKSYKETV